MIARLVLLGLAAAALTFLVAPAAAAPADPDLAVAILVEPEDPAAELTARVPATVTALVSNGGDLPAGPFEVELWCSDASWSRHVLNATALQPGASLELQVPGTYAVNLSERVTFWAEVDPNLRVAESSETNNSAELVVWFPPPAATAFTVDVPARESGTQTLPAYSFLALAVRAREGDAIIFQADALGGGAFDIYLMNEANYSLYRNARADPNATVVYFDAYSATGTNHTAFTTDPLPEGTYYLVIENDERLLHGAPPVSEVRVRYSVATVNNALPATALILIAAAAAAAIWATVKWRPAFDVRSPLLEVPPPEPEETEDDSSGELDEEAAPAEARRSAPPRPPRAP